jgi:hypothetical protein
MRARIKKGFYNPSCYAWVEQNIKGGNIRASWFMDYDYIIDSYALTIYRYKVLFSDICYALLYSEEEKAMYIAEISNVEMLENEIQVGDTVKVINSGKNYPNYESFFKYYRSEIDIQHIIRYQYARSMEEENYNNRKFTVVFIGKHLEYDINLYVIRDTLTNQVWLIEESGIEKC